MRLVNQSVALGDGEADGGAMSTRACSCLFKWTQGIHYTEATEHAGMYRRQNKEEHGTAKVGRKEGREGERDREREIARANESRQ